MISGPGVDYARWCLEEGNDQVPHYVKLQAAQWLEIAEGKNLDAVIDEEAYAKVLRLLGLMVHPDLNGPMAEGLESYAWFLITAVFATKTPEGDRYYETAVLLIGRKNYKTFVSGIIFILLLLTEAKFSRFFSVAPDLKLSSELKLAIRKIIRSSPELDADGVFKLLRSEIRCLLTESDYTPLAYSEDRMDGKLANAFLADEAGAMDGYPIDAMRSSQITLASKLGIIISTQYPNDNNGMIDEIDISKKTLDGLLDNRRRFSLLFEPDDELRKGDAWMHDDRVIYQANPVCVTNQRVFNAVKDLRTLAVLYENRRENFLCKHCNIKYRSLGVEGYVDVQRLRECPRITDAGWWKGRRVFVGVDLSQTDDNTAVAMVCMDGEDVCAAVWGFMPEAGVELKSKREGVNYQRLIDQGDCYACGEEVIDYGFVERFVLELQERYGVEIVQLGYDRYNALSSVQKWEAAYIECVEVKQHSSILHSPTKLMREKILERRFRYGDSRLFEINIQNARCTEDTNRNKYVNKKKSNGKVDMVVAVLNALYLAEQDQLDGGGFVAQVG